MLDIAVWAVPFGIVGARIYHVITSPQAVLRRGRRPVEALRHLGGRPRHLGRGRRSAAVGAWIACRRRGIPLPAFADALAPGLLVAQAIGRFGNWFNNELYGGPTDLPWGLQIHELDGGRAAVGPDGKPIVLGYFHPTFLYEVLWNLGVAACVIWADRRFKLGHGRAFALYVRLQRRPVLDRAAAHRRGRALLRRPAQRVHLDRRLPRRAWPTSSAARPAARGDHRGEAAETAGRRRRDAGPRSRGGRRRRTRVRMITGPRTPAEAFPQARRGQEPT